METRAPYVVVGAFVLAAIAAVFGFVYWLQNTGGLGPRTSYHVQFEGSVPGLLVGAAVLFNGIRVGEVTGLGLAPDNPRGVNATISVASTTPVRADTKVGLEFQGLTGVPVIALEGGGRGVTSNTICPAYVRTPLVEKQIADQARIHGISEGRVVEEIMLTEPAIKRLIEPSEVAELVANLCSAPASFANGSSYLLDGGWSAR